MRATRIQDMYNGNNSTGLHRNISEIIRLRIGRLSPVPDGPRVMTSKQVAPGDWKRPCRGYGGAAGNCRNAAWRGLSEFGDLCH